MSRHIAALPAAAIDDPAVSDPMLRMLVILGQLANKDGWCWPELDILAQRIKAARPYVSKLLKQLRAAGYLDAHYEVRNGRRRVVMRVLFDRPVATAHVITEEEFDGVRVSSQETQAPAVVAVEGAPRVSSQETQPPARVSSEETGSGLEFPLRRNRVSPQETVTYKWLTTTTTNTTKGTSLADASALVVVDGWNAMASTAGLPKARLTEKRRKVIGARLREDGWLEDFDRACTAVAESPWHRGANDRGWVATLDFLLQAGKATELAERASVERATPAPRQNAPAATAATAGAEVQVGPQRFAASTLWALWVRAGLTSPMLTREMVAESVARLAQDGAVTDPDAFTAITLAIEPAELARITWEKTRTERLTERLADWTKRHAEAA